jgi:hypothetical protein
MRMTQFRQIEESERSVELRPIAMLRLEPEDFEQRYALRFRAGVDDLDYERHVLVQVGGEQFGLLRYARAPEPGVELHAEANGAPEAQRQRFLDAFGIDSDVVAWALPGAAAGTR